jgi:hypothetical protein
MIVELDGLYTLVPTFITEVEYEFLWALRGYSISNPIVIYFTQHYGLTRTEIPIPPLDEVPVYTFDVVLWAHIKVFIDEHGAGCASPCKLLTFPL